MSVEIKWIKLSTSMFDDEKIKLIRTMPEGDSITLIWVQLLCLAGKINDGGAVYLGQNLAYSDEMLATIFDHPLSTMRIALRTLKEFNLIEFDEEEKFKISNWEKHQSTDKMARIRHQNRERKRRYDLRTKLRELGHDPDTKEVPSDVDKLEEYVKEIEGNVTVTLRNAPEVRGKKKEVRSKKSDVRSKKESSPNYGKPKYDDDSPYFKLAKHLFNHIKKRNPNHKKPNFQLWADDFRKTVELDERTIKEVKDIIDWSQENDFWQNNILSAGKLRKQYDQLYLRMNESEPVKKERDYSSWKTR